MRLATAIAVLLATCAAPVQADLIDGLQLYLPLNGNALDASSNGTHGMNSGVTWTHGYLSLIHI